jgi:hypothetical protein
LKMNIIFKKPFGQKYCKFSMDAWAKDLHGEILFLDI